MIYLDSSFCIYAVEGAGDKGEKARQALASGGDEVFAVSPLVLLECLVKPFREADVQVEDSYRVIFTSFTMLPITVEAYERAARLRATANVRTPDALHWATAALGGCSALWTGDQDFARATRGYAVDIFA